MTDQSHELGREHPVTRRCDVCGQDHGLGARAHDGVGWEVADLDGRLVWCCPPCSRAAGFHDDMSVVFGMPLASESPEAVVRREQVPAIRRLKNL